MKDNCSCRMERGYIVLVVESKGIRIRILIVSTLDSRTKQLQVKSVYCNRLYIVTLTKATGYQSLSDSPEPLELELEEKKIENSQPTISITISLLSFFFLFPYNSSFFHLFSIKLIFLCHCLNPPFGFS